MEDDSGIGRVGSLLLTQFSPQDVAIHVLYETESEVRVVYIAVPDPHRVGDVVGQSVEEETTFVLRSCILGWSGHAAMVLTMRRRPWIE
jgi:hypothetical protein